MSKKNFVVLVAGIGDTLTSNNSRKKIKNNDTFVEKIEGVLKHLTKDAKNYAIVDFNYPSDTKKDVNVFEKYPKTKNVGMKIHASNLLDKDNELSITSHDGEELLFNGTEFTFLFRPEEYNVYVCGIDLHGIFTPTIKQLLEAGYKVSVFSDAVGALPPTHKYISSLQKEKKFDFCSYKSV